MKNAHKALVVVLIFLLSHPLAAQTEYSGQGKLFLIGGGVRPPKMMKRLIRESRLFDGGFVALLPMASSLPDTAVAKVKRQFVAQGINNVVSFNFTLGGAPEQWLLDSLSHARLIYIIGGDALRFLEVVSSTGVDQVLKKAFRNGVTIAGTSAGAAVLGTKVITGVEIKHPEYSGEYRAIEAQNIELADGLGLVEHAIIDQHFVRQLRMNRLISVAIENPEETCIGVDESAAILVKDGRAEVIGQSQVIVLKNPNASIIIQNGLLGAEGIELGVYLPGEKFYIKK